LAALTFAYDTLRTGGHFVCKFYQGAEDKALETKLKRLFAKVSREKPDSSRSVNQPLLRIRALLTRIQESKEAYFVALRRKEAPAKADVFRD
jgi:21S rRNA (uridine2791-2'-O)-methyltransferase